MRIAIANAGICCSKGGSERAALRLAEGLKNRGHETHILTIAGPSAPVYPIDSQIGLHIFPVTFLRSDEEVLKNVSRILAENKIDIFVSFESDWKHVLWKIGADYASVPFVCSERSSPANIEHKFWNKKGRLNLLESSYAIHILLPEYLRSIPQSLHHKTMVIPNAAPKNILDHLPDRSQLQPTLLYLARFLEDKRPHLLIQAFALLASEFPDWRLRMAGWGETEPFCRQLVKELNIESRVNIGPAAENSMEEYLKAHIYCLPTRFEGFPNTVLEAMAAGLPVVGISDCSTMKSIIRNGTTGVLSKDRTPEELANVLRPLLASEKIRERMGKEAFEECKRKYLAENIFEQWDHALQKVIEKNNF